MNNTLKKIAGAVFLIAAVIAIVFAIVVFTAEAGSSPSYQTYGGDAYTGIQNAAASTASNVKRLTEAVSTGLGAILLVLGVAMIACGVKCFVPAPAPAVIPAPAPVEAPVPEKMQE